MMVNVGKIYIHGCYGIDSGDLLWKFKSKNHWTWQLKLYTVYWYCSHRILVEMIHFAQVVSCFFKQMGGNKKHHLEKYMLYSKWHDIWGWWKYFNSSWVAKTKKHHLPSPETSKSQLNMDAWKTIPFLLGVGLLSGAFAVSFRERISFSPHLKASSNVLSDWSIFLDMCRNKSKSPEVPNPKKPPQ